MICQNHIDVSTGIRRCFRCGSPFCPDCLVELRGYPYCATCKSEQLLDVRSGVNLTQLDLAGIVRRWAAYWLDSLIFSVPTFIVMGIILSSFVNTGKIEPFSPLFQLIGLFFIPYEALMLRWRGQTLGKMALRVKVVNIDGSDISTGQAWGRACLRAILGLLLIIDYIPAFFSKEKLTIHDMGAKTRVVNWS